MRTGTAVPGISTYFAKILTAFNVLYVFHIFIFNFLKDIKYVEKCHNALKCVESVERTVFKNIKGKCREKNTLKDIKICQNTLKVLKGICHQFI